MTEQIEFDYDVFISHASEDKKGFVAGFATRLIDLGVKVWYDEFALDVGDSLSASIDKGLTRSNYGIVVLSDSFIKKAWPEYELRSLLSLQVGKRKRILPIWHEIDKETLLQYSPYLADLIALNTQDGLDITVLRIIQKVRPDIFQSIKAWSRFRQMINDAEPHLKPIDQLKRGRRLRDRLTDGQMRRVRIICALLDQIDLSSFEQTYDSFLRDLPVEDEIQHWEWLALIVYLYRIRQNCSLDEVRRLFRLLIMADFKKIAELVTQKSQIKKLKDDTGVDIDLLLQIINETNQHPKLNNED